MKRLLSFILILAMTSAMGVSAAADDGFSTLPAEPHTLVGDISLDGRVDARDALEILRFSVSKITYFPDSEEDILKQQQRDYYLSCANIVMDVTNDNKVNAADALCILQYAVEKIDRFPRTDYSELQTLIKPGE